MKFTKWNTFDFTRNLCMDIFYLNMRNEAVLSELRWYIIDMCKTKILAVQSVCFLFLSEMARLVWCFVDVLQYTYLSAKKTLPSKSSPKNHSQINYHRKIIHKMFRFPLLLFFLLQAQTSHGVLVRVFTPPGIAVVKGDLWKHTTIDCFFLVINSTPIWTDQDPYERIRIQSMECH